MIVASWIGRKQYVKHMKVFGSLSYKHIPDQIRSELDDKNGSMLLIEYHAIRSYKLYNLVAQKAHFNRDMIVNES